MKQIILFIVTITTINAAVFFHDIGLGLLGVVLAWFLKDAGKSLNVVPMKTENGREF